MVKGPSSEWGSCSRTVSLRSGPIALSYWKNTIAVGCQDSDIIVLDVITGSQLAVLSGHTDWVRAVTFSSDGRSLGSGSEDKTVKLWDMQTGGVVKTFYGHNNYVYSVSISRDYTRIVSGSEDHKICLWDIQTGECLYSIKQQGYVEYVCFSPTDPQHIISISCSEVWEWDINSQQISPLYDATYLAFSPDYTQLVLCDVDIIVVLNFSSGAIVAQSNPVDETIEYCCFSPDGKLIAAAAAGTAYVWDVTGPDCCLVETFVGHADYIRALAFSSPSSLISISDDGSAKFWQIGAFSQNKTVTNFESVPLILSPIRSVSLQARAGIAISSDGNGVVKTWDLLTGLCKASFKTPVDEYLWRDVQLIDGRLIIVWHKLDHIHIWDLNKNEPLHVVDISLFDLCGLRISGDGLKVFCLTKASIQAWSIDTGQHIGKVESGLGGRWNLDPLQMDNSRVWIRYEDLSTQGWDFGTSSSFSIPSSIGSAGQPPLEFFSSPHLQNGEPSWIKDTISGKEVFQLSGRHTKPRVAQWDGQYLIAGYNSGELLILDFHHVSPVELYTVPIY